MGVHEDLARAAGHVGDLRRDLAGIQSCVGTTIDVQRLRDDIARMADDLDLLGRGAGVGTQDRAGAPGEIVFIPDEDYDPGLWSAADDEGIGPGRDR